MELVPGCYRGYCTLNGAMFRVMVFCDLRVLSTESLSVFRVSCCHVKHAARLLPVASAGFNVIY